MVVRNLRLDKGEHGNKFAHFSTSRKHISRRLPLMKNGNIISI